MNCTDLVFDLYGTLVEIHTEETGEVWEETARYFTAHGAAMNGPDLFAAFRQELARRNAAAGQSYECFPEIPFDEVMDTLYRRRGGTETGFGLAAARHFRSLSTEYIRLYPGVLEALRALRGAGYRLWLLTNAQRAFTELELEQLGLADAFDGVYISSDHGCRKPDRRFFSALLTGQGLTPRQCLMIGNDRETDILGGAQAGMATLFLHTNLTPRHQPPADPSLGLRSSSGPHFEEDGPDWPGLAGLLCRS